MENVLNDEWPDAEVEQKFDWSLSLKEIERRYRNLVERKKYGLSKEQKIEKIRLQLGFPDKKECLLIKNEFLAKLNIHNASFSNEAKPNPSDKAINIIKENPKLTLTEFIDRLTSESEPNFHCE